MRWAIPAALLFLCLGAIVVEARIPGIRWYGSKVSGDFEDAAIKGNGTKRKHVDRDYCYIDKNFTDAEVCNYVQEHSDKCEGGGYLMWTRFVSCEYETVSKVFIIIGAVVYLLYMLVALSSSADDFFSPAVAGIVAHLGISESIAGVTFMAFGNGAPDIFGSIASVLSTPKPKAGLALGELLGAGIFVTSCVTATIVFTKPFRATVFETVRDLVFYLVALGWILFVFIYSDEVELFQPLVFLGVYLVYVGTVIFSHFLHKRRKKQRRSTRHSSRIASKVPSHTSRHHSITGAPDQPNEVHIISAAVEKLEQVKEANGGVNGHLKMERTTSGESNGTNRLAVRPTASNPVDGAQANGKKRLSITRFDRRSIGSQKSSKYLHPFYNSNPASLEHENNGGVVYPGDDSDSESEEGMIWVGHHLISASANRSRAQSMLPPAEIHSASSLFSDVLHHVIPLSKEDWDEAGYVGKAFLIVKIPITIAFCLTIPLTDLPWSKPVALLHSIFAPQLFLFAIQEWDDALFDGWPGLWAFGLAFSAIICALIIFFTNVKNEPRFYKALTSYAGFLMAIAWIYMIANEVVGVVTMLGVISQLSHEVLGLTILAWSNSIGDMIADVAVVKQGYPNMALAAAFGGPLFNLLIGFGLPFSIARLKGTTVQVEFSTVSHILIIFLGLSLSFSLVALFVQRFNLRRIYAGCLVSIYAGFIAMVILAETKVFKWGEDEA